MISSMKPVCSPRIFACSENMLAVAREIAKAITNERGVRHTTMRVIHTLTDSMNKKVPSMVHTPVKNWVKPIRRPSASWSTSAITRLMISPEGCRSIYERGSFSIFAKTSFLSFSATPQVIRLLMTLTAHCDRPSVPANMPMRTHTENTSPKSTAPGPVM